MKNHMGLTAVIKRRRGSLTLSSGSAALQHAHYTTSAAYHFGGGGIDLLGGN